MKVKKFYNSGIFFVQGGGHGGLRCFFFLSGVAVNKIPSCGVAVISNPTVCDICVFKPTVFGETQLVAMLRFFV